MASDPDRFDAVADELYGLPISEFTPARDRQAVAARQAGDRELAGEIKKLRRPTVGAWLTNQLVRQRGAEVAALLGVGSALRDAQAQLATDDLRRLSQQAQQVVTTLGREARTLAQAAGQRVGEGAGREVEDTLHAALADPAASDAVRSGRLTTALSYAGFGSVEAPATTGSKTDRAADRKVAGRRVHETAREAAQEGAHETAREAAQTAAEKAVQEAAQRAQAELEAARQEATAEQRRLEQARQQQAQLEQHVQELTEQLDRLRGQVAEAAATVRDAARAYRNAERRVARAEAIAGGA